MKKYPVEISRLSAMLVTWVRKSH